jgi:hypothetical protein
VRGASVCICSLTGPAVFMTDGGSACHTSCLLPGWRLGVGRQGRRGARGQIVEKR